MSLSTGTMISSGYEANSWYIVVGVHLSIARRLNFISFLPYIPFVHCIFSLIFF